ncbi:unnamed protein product, partial [Scytosiphon promiscuus]
MSMEVFEDDRWLHLMSAARMQELLPVIDRIRTAMVDATFNSGDVDERARHHFMTHTLPCAVAAIMDRADLDDGPAQTFLMHCIQFFITTLDRETDNEALLEALRPVLLFRPQAVHSHRGRQPTSGPYDFYISNMQNAGAVGAAYEIQGAPSLYREYNRDRRRRQVAARLIEQQEKEEAEGNGGAAKVSSPGNADPAEQEALPRPANASAAESPSCEQSPRRHSSVGVGRADGEMGREDSEDDLIGARQRAAATAVSASAEVAKAASGKGRGPSTSSSSSSSSAQPQAADMEVEAAAQHPPDAKLRGPKLQLGTDGETPAQEVREEGAAADGRDGENGLGGDRGDAKDRKGPLRSAGGEREPVDAVRESPAAKRPPGRSDLEEEEGSGDRADSSAEGGVGRDRGGGRSSRGTAGPSDAPAGGVTRDPGETQEEDDRQLAAAVALSQEGSASHDGTRKGEHDDGGGVEATEKRTGVRHDEQEHGKNAGV